MLECSTLSMVFFVFGGIWMVEMGIMQWVSSWGWRGCLMLTSFVMNYVYFIVVIVDGVEFGEGNIVGLYVVILGLVWIGDGNWIGFYVVIGILVEICGIDYGVDVFGLFVGIGVVIGSRNVVWEYMIIY